MASVRGKGRERLIRAAAECYISGGRGALTINAVCSEAGVSVGTFYHHFSGGMRDLEGALYIDTLRDYQDGLILELERHSSAYEGVKGTVEFHLDWMASNVALAHFLLFFSTAWLDQQSLDELGVMNIGFARAAEEWRAPHVEAGRIRRLPDIFHGPLVLGPAQQFASMVIANRDIPDVAKTIRDAAPVLAKAAWRAVGRETG
jgi:AcrR family transcriptional regulator